MPCLPNQISPTLPDLAQVLFLPRNSSSATSAQRLPPSAEHTWIRLPSPRHFISHRFSQPTVAYTVSLTGPKTPRGPKPCTIHFAHISRSSGWALWSVSQRGQAPLAQASPSCQQGEADPQPPFRGIAFQTTGQLHTWLLALFSWDPWPHS